MDLDDAPKKPANMVIGENLDAISVAELEQRIQALNSRSCASGPKSPKNRPAAAPPMLSLETRLTALTNW